MFRWIRPARNSTDGVIDSRELASDRGLHLLSIVIPARNEERCIAATVEHLHLELEMRNVPHEIVVVDDASSDSTFKVLEKLQTKIAQLVVIKNEGPHGFGRAVIRGVDAIT